MGGFLRLLPNTNTIETSDSKPDVIPAKDSPVGFVDDFKKILDELIESKIFKFDKEKFIAEGFERAKLTHGDHQTLHHTLETLYADFVNRLDIAQEKKDTLFVNIKELKNTKINQLELDRDNEIYIIESETKAKESQLNYDIENISAKVRNLAIEKESVNKSEIGACSVRNEDLNSEIANSKIAFNSNKLRWHELAPAMVIASLLLVYLLVFYSSAAYILIFSTLDAKLAQMNGIPIVPSVVFDPQAITKAFAKGGTAPLFMGLFVIIPIGLAIIKKIFSKLTVYANVFIWLSIFLVDTLIAYVVAKSIHNVDYLSGKIDEKWMFSDFYTNENFFLVFIMGALGLVIFKFAYEKIYNAFDERNKDVSRARNLVVVEQLKDKIELNEKKIREGKSKIVDLDLTIGLCENDKRNLTKSLSELPVSCEREIQFMNKSYQFRITEIEDIVSIYQSRIDNNDLKFSIGSLKDRVNTFLEGWINYLHETYSVHKAIKMSNEAGLAKNQWIALKVSSQDKQR